MIPNKLKSCFVTMAMAGPTLTPSPMMRMTGVFMKKKLPLFLRLRREGMAALPFIGPKCLYCRRDEPGHPSHHGFRRSKFFV